MTPENLVGLALIAVFSWIAVSLVLSFRVADESWTEPPRNGDDRDG